MIRNLPSTAFVIFSSGAFGGAEKRFTNLFLHFQKICPGKFHFIINPLMHQHIKRIFTGIGESNIHVIDNDSGEMNIDPEYAGKLPVQYNDIIADPLEVDENTSIIRKYYWYYKNRNKQKRLFEQIEEIRKKENINVLIGIFAGGIPLMFYIENKLTDVKIIFSDMDSWFSEVLSDTKKLWYRKYYSFNYILENADKVDFLSPYVADGVKKLGVSVPAERISIAPCSFIDYNKCLIGAKNKIEIAFASRLEPDKNPMLYLESARETLKEFPSVKFHLLGEGSLVNEINKFILDNNLSGNINFTFHNNPPEMFKETLIFVSLQTGTNYPSQSVLEAMACGNAIVASNAGDTNLFVDDSNGILVELNVDSIVRAIKKLIADVSAAKILGLQAAKFAKANHTIGKVSEYYLDLINSVIDQGKHE